MNFSTLWRLKFTKICHYCLGGKCTNTLFVKKLIHFFFIKHQKGMPTAPTKHRWCTPLATKIYNIYILFKTQENSRAAFCIYKIRVVPLSTKVVGEVNSLFKVENLIKRWRAKLWFWETENVILNINIDRHNSAQWTDRIHVTFCRLTSGGPCKFVIPALYTLSIKVR